MCSAVETVFAPTPLPSLLSLLTLLILNFYYSKNTRMNSSVILQKYFMARLLMRLSIIPSDIVIKMILGFP